MEKIIKVTAQEGKGMSTVSLFLIEEYYKKGYTVLELNESIEEILKWA